MITLRALGPDVPRNRLYRDMTEFYLYGNPRKCRVGVYKVNWNNQSFENWHWWCPGCQNRQAEDGWHELPVDIQGWGSSWVWAMNEAWKHVQEVQLLDSHDESVDPHHYA